MMTPRETKLAAVCRFARLVPLACTLLAIAAAPLASAQYSSVPYQETFSYGDGTDLDGLNGWQIYDGSGTYGELPEEYHGWMPKSGSSATAQGGEGNITGLMLENWFGDYTGNPGTDGEYDKDTLVTVAFELELPSSITHTAQPTSWSKYGNMFDTKRWHYENRSSRYKMMTSVRWFVKTNGLVTAYDGHLMKELTHTPISGPTRVVVQCDYTNQLWSLSVGGTKIATDFKLYGVDDTPTYEKSEVLLFDGWYKDFDGLKSVRMVSPTTENVINVDDFFVSRTAPGPGVLPFAETFDTIMTEGDLHGQNGWYATSATVGTTGVRTGSFGATVTGVGECFHTFTNAQTNVWTDIWVKPVNSGAGNVTIDCGGEDAVFYIDGDNPNKGKVYAFDGVTETEVATIDETVWTRFVVYTDYSNSTWSLDINGTEIASGLGFKTVVANDYYQEVSVSSDGDVVTYVDDLSIELQDPDWLPTVTFQSVASSNEEEVATAQIDLVLDAPHNSEVTVDVTLLPASTATDPDDVTGTSTTVTFAAGSVLETMTLAITDDFVYEFAETVVLGLSNPVEAIIGASSNHTYTILDSVDSAAPTFSSDPILELDATEDVAYSSTIADDASDSDGDPLTFTKISGGSWLNVAEDGALTGTPLNEDVGTNTFTVVVTAVGGSDTSTLQIVVLNVNDAPEWDSDPLYEIQATENTPYSSTLADNVTDVDIGAELTYAYVSGPASAWLNVATNGVLSGTPANSDAGTNSFQVSVSDGIASPVQVELIIAVGLDAPVGLVATPGDSEVDLAWDASTGADSYIVKRATVSGGPYAPIGTSASTNYNDATTVNGTDYYYVVAAVAGGVEGVESAEAMATPLKWLPFVEDFEALTPGDLAGQNGWEGEDAIVQTALTIDAKAASVTSSTGFVKYRFADTQSEVWTDFRIQPVFGIQSFVDVDPDTTYGLVINTNGNPVVFDGTNQVVLSGATFTTGSWMRVTIKSDYAAKTWDLYIDNVLLAQDLGFYNSAVTSYSEFGLKLGWEDRMALDNVGIDHVCPLPPPPAPTGLVAAPEDQRVDLSWDAVAEADSYSVLRALVSGGPYTAVASPTGAIYTDNTVTNGTTYYYVVSAVNVGGESGYSNETNATPQLFLPDVPTSVNASGGDAEVTVSWGAAARASAYNVKRATVATGPYTTIVAVASTSYIDSAVTNNGTYYYVVSATNATGESADSSYVSATPIVPVPTGLVAIDGDAQVDLVWNAAAGALNYNVKRADAAGGPYTTIASPVTTNLTDNTVTNGGTYYYVVSTVSAGGESADSSYVSASPQVPPPPTPTGLNATAGDGVVDLVWDAATGADTYHVKRSIFASSNYVTIVSQAGTGYSDTAVTNDVTYYYVVSAGNPGGESADSAAVSATPIVPVPTGLIATAGDGVVDLAWDAADGALSYNVKRSRESGGTFTNIASEVTTAYSDTTVTNNGTYYYVVATVSTNGESADSSEASATPIVPVPTGLIATPDDGVVDLTWTAADGALTYNVKRAVVTGGPYTTIATPAATSYSDTNVVNGTEYFYVVSTVSINSESADSAEVSATPQIPVPPAPTGINATPGDSEVVLNWTASPGADNYNVKRATVSGGPYTTIASPTGTTYTDTAVTNNTTYYYVLSAENITGEGVDSGEVSATPLTLLPFFEDFETLSAGALNQQNGWEANDTIVQGLVAIETQAGSITAATGVASHRFGGSETDVWSDFMAQPKFQPAEIFTPDVDATVAFVINTNGNPVVMDGTNTVVLSAVSITEGAWARFSIHSDYTTKTWNLYVNNALIASHLGFYNDSVSSFSEFVAVGSDTLLDEMGFGPSQPFGLMDRNATIILVK